MTASNEELELKDRLNLIETMIAEGRRTTESWGWVFVLWGLAYYVAIAWDIWGGAQPICMACDHDSHLRTDGSSFYATGRQPPADHHWPCHRRRMDRHGDFDVRPLHVTRYERQVE